MFFSAAAAYAQTTQVVVLTGDAAPDGNGTLSTINSVPALNDLGQAAFEADLVGTSGGGADDLGVFRADAISLALIARRGQASPDGDGTFANFGPASISPLINDAGQVTFFDNLNNTSLDRGIFRGSGTPASLTTIVRKNDPAPDGNGVIDTFGDHALNNLGQVAFRSSLTGTSGGSADNLGLYRGDGTTLVEIVRKGDTAPGGNGMFSIIDEDFVLNDAGQVAFFAILSGTSGGSNDNQGVFRSDGTTLVEIARKGDAAPDGNGTFIGLNDPAINNAGQAAFRGNLDGTSGGETAGVFIGDGVTLGQIVRKVDAAPDGNGAFSGFGNPTLNDSGQAAFTALLDGTSGGLDDDRGIFRGDALTGPTQIVRKGQAAPDGNGLFASIGNPALNDAGQVAFAASLSGTLDGTGDDRGIFFFDELLGLLQVAREGDSFLGSTITALGFQDSIAFEADEGSGLNNLGQVAYRFTLADGREGVAIWTIPEPASLALLGLGGLGLFVWRWRPVGNGHCDC